MSSILETIFSTTVETIFSSGTGEFDEKEVYTKVASDMGLDADKARRIVHKHAKSRYHQALAEAMMMMRQGNQAGVISSLNDALACDKAFGAEPLWGVEAAQLKNLYEVYTGSNTSTQKLARLRYLLCIS